MPRGRKPASPFPTFTPPPKPALTGPTQRARLDPEAVPLRDGVPIPPIEWGPKRVSPYEALFNRMKPGQMAELEKSQASNFVTWARKKGKSVTRRWLGDGKCGVWRNE